MDKNFPFGSPVLQEFFTKIAKRYTLLRLFPTMLYNCLILGCIEDDNGAFQGRAGCFPRRKRFMSKYPLHPGCYGGIVFTGI